MRKILVFSAFVLFLASCQQSGKDAENRVAKGGKTYGGCFRYSELESFQTLLPYAATENVSVNFIEHIYEGLVKFNSKTLSVEPLLAEKWTANDAKTEFTFHLKKGVHFQDDACFPEGKGREVKASDIKYSFEQLCTNKTNNFAFGSSFKDRVLGATKYYEASAKGKPSFDIEGIKVVDDYTIKIVLEKPTVVFLEILAGPGCVIIPKEGYEKYGDKISVGTGPFKLADVNKDKIYLVRNPNYHGVDSLGNQLPFLDSIEVTIVETKAAELELFLANKLDMINGLPSESVNEILEQQINDFQKHPPKFILARSADYISQYYEFNMAKGVFKDKKVRQAFNYAINREKIVKDVLNEQAYGPGQYGIVPPTMKGYDATKIKGYTYDPEKAKKLLAEAGFPNGKGFPTIKLELNSGGAKNSNVAFEIQSQLQQGLGVNISLEVVPMAKKLDDAQYARADMFRSAWVADYPNPETFLNLAYGKNVPATLDLPSFPNHTRYVNPKYDELFEKAKFATNIEESMKLYQQAEQMMMDDSPFMVLWYDEDYKMLQANVRDFFINPLRKKDLSRTYLKEMEKKQEKKEKGKES